MSDTDPRPDSIDEKARREIATRRDLYRTARQDPEWFLSEVVPEAIGILRSLALFDHGAEAQKRAGEAIATIDALVAAKLEETSSAG